MSIPIYMLGSAGVSKDKDPLMSPCINCLVINQHTGARFGTFAMLDSGAYPNVISALLAEKLGLISIGADTLHAALSVEVTNIYPGQLAVEGLPGSFDMIFQAANHHLNGHPYELILGRKFLTAFDFGFSRSSREWFLSYTES